VLARTCIDACGGTARSVGTVNTNKAVRTAGYSEVPLCPVWGMRNHLPITMPVAGWVGPQKYRWFTATLQSNVTRTVSFVDLRVVLADASTPTTFTLTFVTSTLPVSTPTPTSTTGDSDGGVEATAPVRPPPTEAPLDLTRPPKSVNEEVRLKVVTATTASSSGYTTGSGGSAYTPAPYGGSSGSYLYGTPSPRLVGLLGNNTYRANAGLPVLPDAVLEALAALGRELAVEGELTQKGYDRRVQALLALFTPVPVAPTSADTTADALAHATDLPDAPASTDGPAMLGGRSLLWDRGHVDDAADRAQEGAWAHYRTKLVRRGAGGPRTYTPIGKFCSDFG
jgi:hypothetical protein